MKDTKRDVREIIGPMFLLLTVIGLVGAVGYAVYIDPLLTGLSCVGMVTMLWLFSAPSVSPPRHAPRAPVSRGRRAKRR